MIKIELLRPNNKPLHFYSCSKTTKYKQTIMNNAEFFAVAAEYFFDAPEQFRINHPELFAVMEKIFHQKPANG